MKTRTMQIQRMLDESMGECELGKTRISKQNIVEEKNRNETMRVIICPLSDSKEQTKRSCDLDVDDNRSLPHESMDEKSGRRNVSSNDNDRLIYATIDRLALKRTRLPLQLLPIDENFDSNEKKEANNEKKETNSEKRSVVSNRKSSTLRRPAYKMRPGHPVPAQWKYRGRSLPRIQPDQDKLESVSKEIAKRLIVFENLINRDCEITRTSAAVSDQKISELPETGQLIGDERTEVNQSDSLQNIDTTKTKEDSNSSILGLTNSNVCPATIKETTVIQITNSIIPKNEALKSKSVVSRSVIDVSSIGNRLEESISISASSDNLLVKPKRYKPEFTFAKNVLNYVPISGRKKRAKKSYSSNSSKNRRKQAINSSTESTSHCEKGEKKDLSRKELRYPTISLPTNFVHLSSATSSRLLWNDDTKLGSTSKDIFNGKLEYHVDYQEFVVANESSKLRKNMERNSFDDKTVYVKIRQSSPTSRTKETRRSSDREETVAASSRISTSSLTVSSGDNERDRRSENRAKVIHLENSQGVPEVVKISENEDKERLDKPPVNECNANAPVYEAMSEFSIYSSSPSHAAGNCSVAGTAAANASFLWGTGRTARTSFVEKECLAATDEKIVISDRDNSIDANGYDAYDDVGLSRLDTEEDLYDDVGLPCTVTKSPSVDTVFEEINVDDELYDDVLSGPIEPRTSPEAISTVPNRKDSTNDTSSEINNSSCSWHEGNIEKVYSSDCRTSVRTIKSVGLLENDENQYLSIGNDYSSVEEGPDDEIQGDSLYDDVELPSQDRVNSLYAGSSSGSQLGSLYNGKESEWEDLEEAAPVLPLPKKNNLASRNADLQASPSKKKIVQRWSRKVRRQKSKASRKNPASRSTSRSAVRGTSTFSDTASDDSNYETLFSSFPSDEFSSGSEEDDPIMTPSMRNGDSSIGNRFDRDENQEAPSKPVPPPPRESSLTETFGKQMKMLRRTWSITKGSLGRMRRRTSTTNVETDTNNISDGGNKYANCEQHHSTSNDGKKYFSFKKHFRKSITGRSTFYLANDSNVQEKLSHNNNHSKEEIYNNSSSGNSDWYTNTDYWKKNLEDESQRNDVDHYSMLDEEPLYQFYAAAAARVAFESDSEGYEEVEDLLHSPSPSTVDLAKPGHRTLWCQTPQVADSTLLQHLTPDEKKVQEAKFEILTSEASYLNSLRVLVDEFLNNHDLVYEVLTPSEREKLFGGVPSVLIASERLLAELESIWREDIMLEGMPELLLNYAQRSSGVYVAYCSNQVSIDTTLKELRSRKGSKFVETITRIETHPACQSLSLHSFLMLPMQRVTRLPLLADAVLSKLSMDNKQERTRWECVLTQLSQVVMECNEGARRAGRLAEMEALERKLEYSEKVPPIVLRDRYLIRRGPVVQMLAKSDADYKLTFGKKYHKTSLYLLLLTDYLLLTKPKANPNDETYTVIDTCKRSLIALEKVSEDSPFAGRNAMVLTLLENHSGRHVEYILTCNNATERERWLDAISPPKPSLVGETLYETWDCPQVMVLYPYAPCQPDELTLQPGDVINVLRKMTDGWNLGEKLLGGEQGWFPGNYVKEVASEHVRARNLRQRHRLLALSASVLQQRAKHMAR